MTDLGLKLPLRIERLEECFKVVDAGGVAAVYVYTTADRERQIQTRRVAPEEAQRIAQTIARALTAEIEGRGDA